MQASPSLFRLWLKVVPGFSPTNLHDAPGNRSSPAQELSQHSSVFLLWTTSLQQEKQQEQGWDWLYEEPLHTSPLPYLHKGTAIRESAAARPAS